MANVVAYVPDLLFGSRVLSAVHESGHEGVLAGDPAALRGALAQADAIVLDLTDDAQERIALVRSLESRPVLAFYSHVETDVREEARSAGFSLVVPRSRMAREGATLVARLLDGAASEAGSVTP
jgi:hypothetical protein